MGVLERVDAGTRCVLTSRHLVGRSELAQLRVDEPNVSGEHATLTWTGDGWELRDLGSRNGTFVGDRRIHAGERVPVHRGAVLRFGPPSCTWRVIDDGPPCPFAIPADGGPPIIGEAGLLAVPSADALEVSIYQGGFGTWLADRDGVSEPIRSGDEVVAAGMRYKLVLPQSSPPTWEAGTTPPVMTRLRLRFVVTRDEEQVALAALHPGGTLDLGVRAHHYLLLTLARARLRDRGHCTPGDEGWLYLDQLARMLGMDPGHVNIAVFRCRRQLSEAGVLGAADIVERRRATRQLRLGVADIEIATT